MVESGTLLASISIFIRYLSKLLLDQLKDIGLHLSTSADKRKQSTLLAGILTLARVTWLFRWKKGVLQNTLTESFTKITAVSHMNQGIKYSQYQIKSAFEIADTNGDGLLTHGEFIEVSV